MQSVKTTKRGARGFDGGKIVKGRKRHMLVDTLGLVLLVVVHSAGGSDPAGARLLLPQILGLFPRLTRIWADGTYRGTLIDRAFALGSFIIDVVTRDPSHKGFQVIKHRWVVELTFAWLGRYRRLSKDYEYLLESSESMIYLAMIRLMVARLAGTSTQQQFAAPKA